MFSYCFPVHVIPYQNVVAAHLLEGVAVRAGTNRRYIPLPGLYSFSNTLANLQLITAVTRYIKQGHIFTTRMHGTIHIRVFTNPETEVSGL